VVSGVKAGDEVITGPFADVRTLADGADVKRNTEDIKATTQTSANLTGRQTKSS
jgi:hypothetical protein